MIKPAVCAAATDDVRLMAHAGRFRPIYDWVNTSPVIRWRRFIHAHENDAMNARTAIASAVLVALIGLSVVAPAGSKDRIPAYVTTAIANPARNEKDPDIDTRRHPAELMAFAGVKPGDKVLDLIPGSGYFTKIFSGIVGKHGHVYSVWPNEYDAESHPDSDNLRALARSPQFTNVSVIVQPANALSAPEPLDVVFTSQNYHDYPDKFMGPTDPTILDRAVFQALKPGGVFIVIDHAAQAGSGLRDTETLHRIDPETVKAQVTAAGFTFEGSSDVLRNPADPHTVKVFDPSIRHHTDQFVFRFRKPRHKHG
jgi:predicted methyltransferase